MTVNDTVNDTANNDKQIEFWNGHAGRTWAEAQAALDAMLAPASKALIERAAPREGERVLDVGCGCGDTSLALAAIGAEVRGIDISEPMLARARERTPDSARVVFACADAASQSFTPDHTLVLSRFGVMFFADPYAAFRNLRTALAAEGRLCFACWQEPRLNPWIAIAGQAVQPFLPVPAERPDPRAPGPFAFADPQYLRGILEHGGFRDIAIEASTPTLHVGDDLEAAMTFLQQVGPLSRVLAELDDAAGDAALTAARDALTPHVTERGLDLGAACWIVHARAG